MEIEENRGLTDKKASEDQWASLVNSLLELSHYSLSLTYSWALRISWSTLRGVWHTWDLEQEGKGK